MIGYKYDYFRYLGFFSAKIEDIFTFLPSRLVLISLPLVSPKINEYGSIIKKFKITRMKYKNSIQENGPPIEKQNDDFTNTSSTDNEYSKWVDNQVD